MFHKEGIPSIFLGSVFTVAVLLLADKFIDELINDTINTIPEKRNRGRPKMTDEEKYNAKLKRLQMKKKNCKELE